MKRNLTLSLVGGAFLSVILASCGPSGSQLLTSNSGPENSSSSSGTSTSGDSSQSTSFPEHTDTEVEAYMASLSEDSLTGHFYYHYLRYDFSKESYANWDVWAWPYRPNEQEGARFDWMGRVQNDDHMSATGDAVVDSFGYTSIDIDLSRSYDGGWDNAKKKIGGKTVDFKKNHDVPGEEKIGLQIVKSDTRSGSNKFWTNDGSNVYVKLSEYALKSKDGSKTSYHAFVTQDQVQNVTTQPAVTATDPFAKDDGTNVTLGNKDYETADWKDKAIQKTSSSFLDEAGIGYQIMVSSFADSDGDGFGDIYGIYKKLDYLNGLGVNVLWLTPIQSSDSYHGYDISDYLSVDPKFGSKISDSAKTLGGVSTESALADYKQLLDAAHKKGMKVVMDLVINHTSLSNQWFIDSAQLSKNNRGFYQWGNRDTQEKAKGQFWYPYGDHVYSYYAKFGSGMPELNFSYASTRAAVESVALNWCERGVDGFRMDAVKHIFMKDEIVTSSSDTIIVDNGSGIDYSSDLTKNLNFWREMNAAVKTKFPNAFFVGENFDGHAYHVAPYYEGFDSLFDFYSYFNLTSLAAKSISNSGAYQGTPTSFLGTTDSGTPYSGSSDTSKEGSATSLKYGGYWNLRNVLSANNQYRGGKAMSKDGGEAYTAINGAFTSNHDIARCINRVAGTTFDPNGLSEQGTVTEASYEKHSKLAACVEIAEFMLPGCTWIYYGDEIGMTGNFPAGKNSKSDYADLYYRQPMKWTDNGKAGDGSMTTSYGITGSGLQVGWDSVNASTKVGGAATQIESSSSHYNRLLPFIKAKATTPALIKGNLIPSEWDAEHPNLLHFLRKLGTETYEIVVNMGSNTAATGFKGTVVAATPNTTINNIQGYGCIVVKTA